MAEFHLDRLKKKYGFKGEKYRDLVNDIISTESKKISEKIALLSKEEWKQRIGRVTTKEKILKIPEINDVVPDDTYFTKKGAVQGKRISDTLRDRLTSNLKDTLREFSDGGGERRISGKINPELINEFEKSIRKTFKNYTRKDKKLGMPKNVHDIAVTEMRSSVNNMKFSYASEVANQNPEYKIRKTWIHNPALSKEPRYGHAKMNMVQRGINTLFNVPLYKKIGNRWIQIGETKMIGPHDPKAPPEQVIGCECDVVFKILRK